MIAEMSNSISIFSFPNDRQMSVLHLQNIANRTSYDNLEKEEAIRRTQ
jgi:hypothetical protein